MHRKSAAETIRVMLVENETRAPSHVEEFLCCAYDTAAEQSSPFALTRARSLGEAFRLLDGRRAPDVVLFDFDLAGEAGPAVLVRLQAAARDLPVIVLADGDDDPHGLAAIRQGIQEWIAKDTLTGATLARVIRHAIARKHVEVDLRRQLARLKKAQSRRSRQTARPCTRAETRDSTGGELDDFVYVVSHDLKEPLRGIRAYCDLLAEDYRDRIDAAGVGRLGTVRAMCERLETQISDLLTYYRVGRMQPRVTKVELTEVVDGQVAALRATIDRVRGAVRVKGPLPTVLGHPVLLGTVFGNLISNGLKYNQSKRPTVEIGVAPRQPSTIYVRDNGIGIAPEHHEAIFALFRRLHGRKEYEGSGAGLTIVRKIVTSYSGRVWLESEPGRGTTFFFSLPPTIAKPTRPPHWKRSQRVPSPSGRGLG